MSIIIDYSIYFISIFFMEFFTSMFFMFLANNFADTSFWHQSLGMLPIPIVPSFWKTALMLSFGRLKYHSLFIIIVTVIVLRNNNFPDRLLLLGWLNTLLYFSILLLYAITINSDLFISLKKPTFYFYAIAIFLSPFLLGRISYFYNVIYRL